MHTRCHLSVLVHEQAKKYGERTALNYRPFGSEVWETMSWNTFSMRVKQVSNALLNMGLKPQDKIAVFSQNCVQYLFTDFGAYGIRVCSVPLYATSSEQQLQFVVNNSGARILFVGEQSQYDKACRVMPLCPGLEKIIVFDSGVVVPEGATHTLRFDKFIEEAASLPRQSEVERLWSEAQMDDVCNILYTSGTTGESKGVMLTYSQYHAALIENDKGTCVDERDRVINFLPFTHIFERGWTYLCISEGCQLIVNTDPREIQKSMRETHPTAMSAVPRFWEKVYTGVMAKIDESGAAKKKLFKHALEVGRRHNVEYLGRGKRPPLALSLEYKLLNKTVFSLVRKQLGLENPNMFPTAGATVSPEVQEFVHSIGIYMMVGYGLTESLATVSNIHKGKPFTVGSVGLPIENIEIKFGENDEILLKGPTITPGYYKNDAANAASFTEDGFFRTGDAGYMKDGELFLKERIKDLFKTSNGKYIAPQAVESLLVVDKFIDQVTVIADCRKFVTALIVPDYALLEQWATSNGVQFASTEELCNHPKVCDMIMDRIQTLQQTLASYEKVKRFTLLPKPFSMESGEMTNTLKLKRGVINKNYAELINKMYDEA